MAIITCWECGNTIDATPPTTVCDHCGAISNILEKKEGSKKPELEDQKFVSGATFTGYVGLVMLIIGAFLPFVKAPYIGSASLFEMGRIDGFVLIALAIVGAFCFFSRHYRLAAVVGFIGAGFVSWKTFLALEEITIINTEPGADFFRDLSGGFIDFTARMDYGVHVLFLAVLLILLAAYRDYRMSAARKEAHK